MRINLRFIAQNSMDGLQDIKIEEPRVLNKKTRTYMRRFL
jgi:hypothetical protein